MALIVGVAQLVFLFNLIWSICARPARPAAIPWRATTLEWQTPRDAAGARQLGQGPAGRLSLGLRLQRARRRAGLHPAERARPHRAPTREPAMSVILVFLARDRRRSPAGGCRASGCMAKPWLEASCDGDFMPRRAARAADREDRARRLSRRRRRAVRAALSAPTSCAWAVHGLAAVADAAAAVGQHGGAGPQQRRAASGAASARHGAATIGRRAARSRRRGGHRARLPRRAARWPGGSLPPAGYLLAANPANSFFYLITGAARPAHLRRPGRRSARVTRRAWPTDDAAARCVSASSSAPSTGISCLSSGSACSPVLAGWAATSSTFAANC